MKKIYRNIIFNYLGLIWSKLLNLILLPVIVIGLGNDAYGLFSIIFVIIGYYSILDLGIGSAVIKYVAQYNAESKKEDINTLISVSFQAFTFLGLGASVSVFLFAGKFVSIIQIPSNLVHTAKIVLYITIIQFSLNLIFSVFSSVLVGMQRLDTLNKIGIFTNTLGISTMAILAKLGYGLIPIVSLNLCYSILNIFLTVYYATKYLTSFKLNLISFYPIQLRKIISFSLFAFIIQAGYLIHTTTDRLLIGVFCPVAFVTFYMVGMKLSEILRFLPSPLARVLLPIVSELGAKKNFVRIEELYIRGTKYILILILPISIILFVFSFDLLKLWMGESYALHSSFVLKLLTVGVAANMYGFISYIVLMGLARHRIIAIYSLAAALINIALDLFLIPKYGINGAAFASALAFGVTYIPMVSHSMWILKIRIESFLKEIGQPLFWGIIFTGVVLAVKFFVKPKGWFQLITVGIAGLAVYYWFNWIGGGIKARDRELLGDLYKEAISGFSRRISQ